ncbi:hypothetical protein N8445_00095 [bacterium]|nr:hypothetical protein [bacterium]
MAAYKKLKKEDSYITSYVAHKTFSISGSQHSEFGVETYIGISGSGEWLPSTGDSRLDGTKYQHYTRLVYNSINHLYYTGYNDAGMPTSSSNSLSGSAYENYLQSSYTANQRRAQGEFTVLSVPQNLFGAYIKPGSVILAPPASVSGSNYVNETGQEYVSESFAEEIDTLYGGAVELQDDEYVQDEETYINETVEEFVIPGFDDYKTTLIDDKNGNLILSASQPQRVVGNVIYSHGLIVITNPSVGAYFANYFSGSLTWQSSQPIYTYNYHCPIKESEYNFSSNPSGLKDTSGSLSDNVTGSYFKPYFTTVGLYNDANELIAVGKMAQATPVSDNNETTVVVKLDI